MARFIFIIQLFLLVSRLSLGQGITFCEKVLPNGTPLRPSATFILSPSGGDVSFLISKERPFECNSVTLDVYQLSYEGRETFLSSKEIPVQPFETFASGELRFSKPGTMIVFAYDETGNLLGTANVSIQSRK